MSLPQTDATSDPQNIVAVLQQRLDAALSASPGDPQPVFDLIVRHAQGLCNSKAAGIFEYDCELVHLRSHYGDRDIV
jgi:hypothetical protein